MLAHLDRSGAVGVREITARVHLDKSIVSRAASRLEAAGLLQKSGHDHDRRLVTLELTPEGRALMRRLARIARAFHAELIAELGADAEAFERALTRLIDKSDTGDKGDTGDQRD